MLFTDPCFLFLFLPLMLAIYALTPRGGRNAVLVAGSVLFYALGEGFLTLIVLFSIGFNFVIGRWIEGAGGREAGRKPLIVGVIVNLALLITFKYLRFIVLSLDAVLAHAGVRLLPPPRIHLPLGISFFTFHTLSYLIDVWRQEVRPMKRLRDFALYIILFPQLIAGPIIRFKFIRDQIDEGGRRVNWEIFAQGVMRFIVGFGKKMLIANTVAQTAKTIFESNPRVLSPGAAWLGAVCYMAQIYFDFSGYTDMAIGLGRMFGFQFPENFDYPYIAGSITDFWRRWHMTLTSWLRDYLYIPMGGNRVGRGRLYLNLLTVFFLCGLWHGAQWTFVIWGLYHGLFLILERVGLKQWLERRAILRHVYVLLVVGVGWVFFNSDTFGGALVYLGRMAFLTSSAPVVYTLASSFNFTVGVALAAAAIGSMPVAPWADEWIDRLVRSARGGAAWGLDLAASAAELAVMSGIFVASAALSAAGTYNPFIYFRF